MKPFKTINEQIELLKSRKLIINEKSKIKWYLENYNYQNIINGYNDPFIKGFRRDNNEYDGISSEQSIIDLFNFDRSISNILLSNIQNIERKLNSSLIYFISKKMNEFGYKFGDVLNLDNENIIQKIFSSKNKFLKFKNETISYLNNIQAIKEDILKNIDNMEQAPIWKLIILLNFGDIIKLFSYLNEDLQYEIINNSFKNCISNPKELCDIFRVLKIIRNRCCHNNRIYKIVIKNNDKNIKNFLTKNKIVIISSKIRLREIIEIIILIENKKNSTLKEEINKRIKKLKESNDVNNDSMKYILKIMNYELN